MQGSTVHQAGVSAYMHDCVLMCMCCLATRCSYLLHPHTRKRHSVSQEEGGRVKKGYHS